MKAATIASTMLAMPTYLSCLEDSADRQEEASDTTTHHVAVNATRQADHPTPLETLWKLKIQMMNTWLFTVPSTADQSSALSD